MGYQFDQGTAPFETNSISITMTDRLIAFYRGTGTDTRGRTLEDVLAFNIDDLEYVHDYIQWLFPLFERSGANPVAPVLDDHSALAFRTDQHLRRQVRRSVQLMLSFYGLELVSLSGRINVDRAPSFDERSREWLTPRNHNFLRLTRILKCLAQIHAAPLAQALLACLLDIGAQHPDTVPPKTILYWKDAVPPTVAGG